MPVLRVVVLWHQHQPYYKDLVTGEYRLPWVRLHALKDYYGMVKLLEEFPQVHQTFNLVPSLVSQIEDYVSGEARDPFLQVASKPASDLSTDERRFALQYLFQANPANMIGRYPRYRELWETVRGAADSPDRAERYFQPQDFTDLQVLSQIAWFDEFFLEEPDINALIGKGRNFTLEEQQLVIRRQRELMAKVLPIHAAAAQSRSVELSTSPFYHPILPLVCDSNQGAVSSPGLPLPPNRFRHPEDAREQLLRGLDLHERVFGMRPQGVWPSEGSVSEEVLTIAHDLGVKWMATDEGVLGRSTGVVFQRDAAGRLDQNLSERLYNLHLYQNSGTEMTMIFRDHAISDLVGFVYSGMSAPDAAHHLLQTIKAAAEPVLSRGRDAVVPVILDGENAWEYYPKSGREFLRRFYDSLQREPGLEAVTISEAMARHQSTGRLSSICPGSWINANFNVWIGAPEDNRSWDYLYQARTFYEQAKSRASESQRQLAYEELLIAEGSDWNWWYGPEHHSANDRDFDELYRKHLSNIYQALGATPPDYLAQPIAGVAARPTFSPQSAFIHPRISGDKVRYFDWMGAATYTADRRSGSMHGKRYLLNSVNAGVDENYIYGRLNFSDEIPTDDFDLVVNLESWQHHGAQPLRALRLAAAVENRRIVFANLTVAGRDQQSTITLTIDGVRLALAKSFEFALPLEMLKGEPATPPNAGKILRASSPEKVRLRLSLWQNHLPVDALPIEDWIELPIVTEQDLMSMGN